MTENVRDLSFGMRGDDVLHLKVELLLLGANGIVADASHVVTHMVPAHGRATQPASELDLFDRHTMEAVRQIQSKSKLPASGIVDETTAAVIRSALEAGDACAVYGFVRSRGEPVDGLVVTAGDRDMRSEQALGKAPTRRGGFYLIPYKTSAFARAEKGRADLVVRAHDGKGKRVLASSDILFNADRVRRLDLSLGAGSADGDCEYDRVLAQVKPLIDQVALEDLTRDDVAFLAGETGIPAERVRYLKLDAAYRQGEKLPAAVFYGLLRQGLPEDRLALLMEKPSRIRDALKASVDARIVPAALGRDLDGVLQALRRMAIEAANQASGEDRIAALGRAARLSGVSRNLGTKFVEFSLAYEGDEAAFWNEARKAIGLKEADVAALQFTMAGNAVVYGHEKTLAAVHDLKKESGWKAARDLARMTRRDWQRLTARTGHPKSFQNAKAYADAIAAQVERSFPTATVAARLEGDKEFGNADLTRFFAANPQFSLLETPIDGFLENGARLDGIRNPAAMRDKLSILQRVMRLVPETGRFEVMMPMIRQGFTSAAAIQMAGERTFRAKMGQTIDDETASKVLANARVRADAVQIIQQGLRDYMTDRPRVLPGITPDPDVEIPSWARQFGSINGCACEHCRSMLSPAAYMVDMLQHLRDAPGEADLLDALFERRPDIRHIELNCANAHARLPYIDLVNEILEAAVADGASVDWRRYQTTLRDAESRPDAEARLRAMPEHRLDAAYIPLRIAEYPWVLPFDRDHARTRILARHLGLDLAELRAMFGGDAADVAMERLGVSEAVWTLLTRPATGVDVRALWGVGTLSELEAVPAFLRQAGLAHEELVRLVRTRFLSADGLAEVAIALSDDPEADPCDLQSYVLRDLRTGAGRMDGRLLDQIHRFIRLQRALGWSIETLDAVLSEAGFTAIGEGALLAIARMQSVAKELNVSVADLAAARGAGLAALFGLADGELSIFAALAGAGAPDTLDLSQRLDLMERWLAFRETGSDLREAAYVLLGRDQTPPAFAPADEDVRRFLLALHAFAGERREADGLDDAAVSELLVDNLARHLGLEARLCDRLLRPITDPDTGATLSPALMGAESDAGAPAISDVLRFVSIAAGDRAPDEAEPALYDHAARLMVRLDRTARLLRGLKIDRRMLEAILATAAENGFLDLGSLRSPGDGGSGAPADLLDGWLALSGAVRLRNEMPGDGPDLFDFLALAADPGVTLARLRESVNAATGWSIDPATGATRRDSAGREIDVVDVLARAMSIARAGFRRIESYRRLHAAVRNLKHWRIGPDVLVLWADPARRGATLADSLEAVARARHADDRAWHETLGPLADELREQRRDALLALLMHREGYAHPSELYERCLIDPEMSSCALTSRIVQANAAIQLFVQRIHLNLENALRPDPAIAERWDAHWRQWDWMRNYRVWEANRKVFLYPENWLEPELRDDKSELFVRLENALLQDEMNEATAEQAFRGFLEGFRQIARLDVRGFHVERETDGTGAVLKHVLHVFARTFAQPYAYFHRRRDLRTGIWSAWRKIDANIEGDHLIPAMRHGQLMLFWPKFREIGDGSKAELTLASSRYRDGAWQSTTIGSAKLVVPAQNPKDFTFRLDTDGDALRILVYRQYYSRAGDRTAIPESYSLCSHAFVYNACNDMLDIEPVRPARMLVHPRRVDAGGMLFDEEDSDGDQLFLTADTIEDDELSFDPEDFEELLEVLGKAGPFGVAVAVLIGGAIAIAELQDVQEQVRSFPLLRSTPGRFAIVPAAQERQFTEDQRFFFQDRERSFLVTPEWVSLVLDGQGSGSWGVGGGFFVWAFRQYVVELFYHPYMCEIIERFDRDGVGGVLAPPSHVAGTPRRNLLDRQYTPPLPSPLEAYSPVPGVATPYPVESIDFRLTDSFGAYNWELFFHIPLLCAVRLSRNLRFEDAQRWFHYIFDPTDRSPHPDPAKFWRVKPFFELAGETPETLGDLLRSIAAGDAEALKQVAVWHADPFNPHAIARCRLLTYMKAVVMAYLDNLFAWADHLFGQDTMESINEAFQIYTLAAEILGDRPVQVARDEPSALTYADLTEDADRLDALSNAWVELESLLPADLGALGGSADGPPVRLMPYFCVPANEKLLSYWDTLADRLFKIRNCMNISGRVRRLALFEPPIDPALLVRARAAGLDLRSVLDARRGGAPHYRYGVMYQKSLQFCGEVRALGQALLSANEKHDGEALSQLRNEHESAMLAQVEEIKKQRIDEAREALEGLRRQREAAILRRDHYRSREYRNPGEQAQVDHLHTARGFEIASQSTKVIAPILYSIPNVTVGLGAGTTYGGTHLGSAVSAAADGIGLIASQFTFEANLSSITGSQDRRRDDWQFQARLAEQEITQLDKQIIAAEIRLAIAENELDNHRLQARQAEEVGSFLDEKFSDAELYGWMQGQLATLHYQSYQMARDLALRAQAAAERELGLTPGELDVIGFDHWDGTRKGLLAAERLNRELLRLDSTFMERNRRSLEITKHVSIQMLAPLALTELKATGTCALSVPEWLFDMDYPGQYNRRIKSVSLTIPCIAGPYTNVSCKLTLTRNLIRYRPDQDPEAGPLMTQSIATSNAQNDSGVFEINFRDDRYLPFEGAGAISDWRLELSGRWQLDLDGDGTAETVDLSQIDFDSISDVILHIKYSAQEADDGGALKHAAVSRLQTLFASLRDTPLARLFSPRHEFGSEWHRFLHPAGDEDGQSLALPLHRDRFPFAFREGLAIRGITILVRIAEDYSGSHNAATLKLAVAEGDTAPDAATAVPTDLATLEPWHGLLRADVATSGAPGRWTLNAWLGSGDRLDPEAVQEMAVVVQYTMNRSGSG